MKHYMGLLEPIGGQIKYADMDFKEHRHRLLQRIGSLFGWLLFTLAMYGLA